MAPEPFAGRGGLQARPDISRLFHQVAAYGVPRSDLPRARGVGISLAKVSSSQLDAGYRAELRQANMGYIDNGLWGLIAPYIPVACRENTAPCELAPARQAELLQKVQAYAASLASDDQLVAFYALDDYPGNIADLLVQVHAAVAIAGRPMICAFMAFLDATSSTGAPLHDRSVPEQAVLNYTPQACDIVSIYAYSPVGTAKAVDWGMTRLLPDVKQMLGARGWNPSEPIIGTPQAFSYLGGKWVWTGPTADQIRAQTAAFCAQGAVALMPYSWHDSYSGPNAELGTDANLQRGFAAGVRDCHAMWGA